VALTEAISKPGVEVRESFGGIVSNFMFPLLLFSVALLCCGETAICGISHLSGGVS